MNEIIEQLRELGDPRAVKVWESSGMDVSSFLGVNLTKIKALAKQLKKNMELAESLWETGIHDARLLACYISEPKKVSEATLDRWVDGCDFWDLSDKFGQNVVGPSQYAFTKVEEWIARPEEFVQRAGFATFTEVLKLGRGDAEWLEPYIERVRVGLKSEQNFVRDGANYAAIALGSFNWDFNQRVIEMLEKVGEIMIDYGDSSCKPYDALATLKSDRVKTRLSKK